ncbi:hypothetical protein IJJ18_00685 [Candidatus Saccharibacteria bacterium]|nr:hypothetical protein [Candidatus Saccharibacteria bacterium]
MAKSATFPLLTRGSRTKLFTPQKLLERVLEDSKSDYNWVASAPELIRTCNLPGFPEGIALEIEGLILQCFTNIAPDLYEPLFSSDADEAAVWTCYLHANNIELREVYLRRIIKRTIGLSYGDLGVIFHRGPEHDQFEQQFIDEKISELHAAEKNTNKPIDYLSWRKSLMEKYKDSYDEAIELGRFNSDREECKKVFSLLTSDR